MIRDVNYNGKIIKCEIKPDVISIILLLVVLFVIPIWMIFMEAYFLACLIHFIALGSVILSKGTVLKNYTPLTEVKQ